MPRAVDGDGDRGATFPRERHEQSTTVATAASRPSACPTRRGVVGDDLMLDADAREQLLVGHAG